MTCPHRTPQNYCAHDPLCYCDVDRCELTELPTPTLLSAEIDVDLNPPTVLTIDESTDLNKVNEMIRPKVRRNLIAMKVFHSTDEFVNWQSEEPREIFEITPQAIAIGERISHRIFVTYNGGVIE